MKFISLFTKTPIHRNFSFSPRYYNPQKEEARKRNTRMKEEAGIALSQPREGHATRIIGSFQLTHRKKTYNQLISSKTTLMRLGIILVFVLLFIAYFMWGQIALYGFLVFIPFYIYSKLKPQ